MKDLERVIGVSVLTAIAGMAAKLIAIGTALVSVPITLNYLGTERYGMWMTMSSFIAMLSFADLGIGNGVLNAVAEAFGRDDDETIKTYVSSSLFILSLIALAIIVVGIPAATLVQWSKVFNVHSPIAKAEATPALSVLLFCIAIAVPASVIQRVQLGLQSGFITNIWQCAGSVLALGGVVAAAHLRAGLPWLVLAFAGCPVLISALNGLIYYYYLKPEFRPAFGSISKSAINRVTKSGAFFFVLQIYAAIASSSDNIVIAQILGASAVAAYAVPQRLFSTIQIFQSVILSALWPAYGEAIARGDRKWVLKTLYRSLAISVGFAGGVGVILVMFGRPIVKLWVHGAIVPSLSLLISLAFWQVGLALGNATSIYLNGMNVIRFQAIVGTITGIAIIASKIVLIRLIGLPGAAWGNLLAFLLCSGLPLFFIIKRMK